MRGIYIRLGSQGEAKALFQCKVWCPESDPLRCCRQLRPSVLSPWDSCTARAFQPFLTSLIPRIKSLPAQNTWNNSCFLDQTLTYGHWAEHSISDAKTYFYQSSEILSEPAPLFLTPTFGSVTPKDPSILVKHYHPAFPSHPTLAIIKLNPTSFPSLSLKPVHVSSGTLYLCLAIPPRLQHLLWMFFLLPH